MSIFILILIALLPAIVLCVYVFKKDRVEKEPIGLLVKLLIFGAISCFPAAYIEIVLEEIINSSFAEQTAMMIQNPYAYTDSASYAYNFVKYFIGVALVEELVKFAVLVMVTRKNKEFNSIFDGIIYSVFVSLGFAALENVLYVLEYGLATAILRAVLSVPGHMFFAVMMGYHYSMWHLTDKAILAERELKAKGYISPYAKEFSSTKSIIMCILVPVLAHGWYDFCCTVDSAWAILALVIFVVFMYVHCFKKIKKMSQNDGLEANYVHYMLERKYPSLFRF